jgi:hypothetical protein
VPFFFYWLTEDYTVAVLEFHNGWTFEQLVEFTEQTLNPALAYHAGSVNMVVDFSLNPTIPTGNTVAEYAEVLLRNRSERLDKIAIVSTHPMVPAMLSMVKALVPIAALQKIVAVRTLDDALAHFDPRYRHPSNANTR